MTYCPPLFDKVNKILEKHDKTLKEIGIELCGNVKHPEDKAIRILRMLKGRMWLIENKDWLEYQPPRNPTGKNGKNKPENSGSNGNNELTDADTDMENLLDYLFIYNFENDDLERVIDSFRNDAEFYEKLVEFKQKYPRHWGAKLNDCFEYVTDDSS